MKDKQERIQSLQRLSSALSQLGQSISSESRFTILTALMDDQKSFQQLKTHTGLKKSALSSHLKNLETTGLVERRHHGVYGITYQGYQLMVKLDELVEETTEYEINKKENEIRRRITDSFLHRPANYR
jgi:predicted transcriptional regulator